MSIRMNMQSFCQATDHLLTCSGRRLLATEHSARVFQKRQRSARCAALYRIFITFGITTLATMIFRLRRLSYSTKLNARGLDSRLLPSCSESGDRPTLTCQSRSSSLALWIGVQIGAQLCVLSAAVKKSTPERLASPNGSVRFKLGSPIGMFTYRRASHFQSTAPKL